MLMGFINQQPSTGTSSSVATGVSGSGGAWAEDLQGASQPRRGAGRGVQGMDGFCWENLGENDALLRVFEMAF